ncbi:MAG: serine hydrolase domain-containing protein [Sphingomonadaceae bacterium]
MAPRLPHPPGERYAYCNVCYDTLALLAERVTGRPYAQLAVDGLLRPAGARDAFLRPAHFRDWPGPRTVGFRSARPDAQPFDSFDAEAIYGGSNIQLSAADLAAWGQAWASGGVLTGPLRRQALAPARIGGLPSAMSLAGWYCTGEGARCYYTGHHQGFFSFVWWDASRGLSVGLMTNSALPFPLQVWLMRALVALAEGRAPGPRPVLAPADARFDMARAAGRWQVPGVGILHLSSQDGETWAQLEGRPATQAYAVGHATLFVPGLGAYLSLAPDDAGRTRLDYATPFVAARGDRPGR